LIDKNHKLSSSAVGPLLPADAAQPAIPAGMGEFDSLLDSRPGIAARFRMRAGWVLSDLRDALVHCLQQEYRYGTLFNFVPVVLAVGIAVYFAAPAEPVLTLVLASMALPAFFALRMTHHGSAYYLSLLLALFFAGMVLAQIRTEIAGGPIIRHETTAQIRGIVLNRDKNSRGSARYLIQPTAIENFAATELPARIRLSASARHDWLVPGQTISGLARMQGMSGPAYPGGYDFGFFNWLDGLGGTGFFMGSPDLAAEQLPVSNMYNSLIILVNNFRLAIAERIIRQIDEPAAAIAIALITGDRSGIDKDIQEDLRQSGLAHVLAISGLHMALVTLTVIWLSRFLLALSPRLALCYPLRKWSAAIGLVTATAYLLVSGGAVATQRAWLMIVIMLCAVLADRSALTMRNVSIAAICILLISPESLLEPGFQMSFSATAALIAAYNALRNFNRSRYFLREKYEGSKGLLAGVALFFGALIFTSLVAGLATGLYSAWHFHRVAPFGLLANVAAMPIVSIAIMPLALASTLLMPYGLEFITLKPLGWAIGLVCQIAEWITEIPVSGTIGMLSPSVLLVGTFGFLLLTLLRSRLRLLGLMPLALVPLLGGSAEAPGLIVSQDGRAIAMKGHDGRLAMPYPRRGRFFTDIWLRAWSGDTPGDHDALIESCDSERCIAKSPEGIIVEIVYSPELLAQACMTADILVAPRLRWVNCHEEKPALILKRGDFEKSGTHMLHFRVLQEQGTPDDDSDAIPVETSTGSYYIEIETSITAYSRPWNLVRIAQKPEI
jgi:competence protein ComEC